MYPFFKAQLQSMVTRCRDRHIISSAATGAFLIGDHGHLLAGKTEPS